MRLLRFEAEAIAWPLVAPSLGGHRVDAARLVAGLRDRLARYGPTAHSMVDDLAAMHLGPRDGWPLWRYLIALAQELLVHDGAAMRLQPFDLRRSPRHAGARRPGAEILRWRFVSLRLPAEVLLAAGAPSGTWPPSHVQILDPALTPAGPLAHLHDHKAMVSSEGEVWAHLPDALRPMGRRTQLASPWTGDPKGTRWRKALWAAQAAWGLLSAHLRDGHPDRLEGCHLCLAYEGADRVLVDLVECAESDEDTMVRVRSWLAELRNAATPATDRAMLAQWLRRVAHPDSDPDGWESRLLCHVLRTRCLLHTQVVSDPTAPGLRSFTQVFRESKPLVPRSSAADLVRRASTEHLPLEAVELRTSLGPNAGTKGLNWMVEAAEQSRVEAGWTIHLIRSFPVGGSHDGGCPLRSLWERSVKPVEELLEAWLDADPRRLRAVRALDVAGRELDGPLWLFAPALKRLRRCSEEIAGRDPSHGVHPLRLTVHVGEDFRNLASGLRAIDEPIAWGLVRRGDRLGHALALGVDPERWVRKNPVVVQPVLERLLDIGWMLDAIPRLGVAADGATLHRLREEATDHFDALGEYGAARTATRLWRWLGTTEDWEGWDAADAIPVVERGRRPNPRDIALRVLRAPGGWHRAQHRVRVATEPDLHLVSALQDALAAHIAEWQLTIEVNPSSNLLIADLDAPLDQPMFHLRPVDPTDKRALPVCISADDPLTFATCLADEYAYAWAGMVVAGDVPPSYARQWLEEAAAASWRARFTLPRDQG